MECNKALAILIGFEYNENKLTGSIIDLYLGYRWCKRYNYKVCIITDIKVKSEEYWKNNRELLDKAINEEIVDKDIIKFTENIEKIYIINKEKEFKLYIREIIKNIIYDNKLIIYYSGHGVNDNILLPDKSQIAFISFRDIIIKNIRGDVEIFWILDCCNATGLNLPYKLSNNSFMLSNNKIEPVTQPILLITSSDSNEKSVATRIGSIFSRQLFYILTNINNKIFINRNLSRFKSFISSSIRQLHTGYNQNVSIYSSYVTDPILWMWISNVKNYDIVTDISLTMLVIRRQNNINIISKENFINTSDIIIKNIDEQNNMNKLHDNPEKDEQNNMNKLHDNPEKDESSIIQENNNIFVELDDNKGIIRKNNKKEERMEDVGMKKVNEINRKINNLYEKIYVKEVKNKILIPVNEKKYINPYDMLYPE